jgi:predicted RNA binding protein YcfA (HicA-like mRNA interferase family)
LTRLEKLLAKLRAEPPEMDFEEVRTLLVMLGCTCEAPRGGGSHYKVKAPNRPVLTVPKHRGKVKKRYLGMIREWLGEEG